MKLSVVVAAQDARDLLNKCVSSLASQLPPSEMEIIVVSAKGVREISVVRHIAISAPHNVPRMWAAGIGAARGETIALTIENCIAAPNWAQTLLNLHKSAAAGIGGAIEPGENASLADWAVYFCRYSNYMLPFAARQVNDFAADNCAYKRSALEAMASVEREGFWETLVHEDMLRRGDGLLCDPALVMRFAGGIPPGRFLLRRFDHGRYFAARRSAGFTFAQKAVRAAGAPLVPLLLTRRIAERIFSKGRHRGKFVACLPLIACFLMAWAAGEGAGYIAGYSGAGPAD